MMASIGYVAKTTLAATAVAVGFLAYAYFVEPHRLVVNQYEMRVENWNPAFDGFRVALISDIHAGSHGASAEKLREIVAAVNEQNVDAVFILGDLIAGPWGGKPNAPREPLMEPAEIAENLKGMHARHGIYTVLGNHEVWYGVGAAEKIFESAGLNVLDGEMAQISIRGGHHLRVLGLPDHTTVSNWNEFAADAKRLVAPSDGQGDLIVLQHSPDVLPAITGQLRITPDPMVMFAGHTHGGQIWLPVIGAPIVPSSRGQKYAHGHIRDGGIDLFVTSGIGTSRLPFRFMVPPEIAVVTIRRK